MFYALVMFRATSPSGEDKAGEFPWWEIVSGPHRAPVVAEDRATSVLRAHNHLWVAGSKRAVKYAVVRGSDLRGYGFGPADLGRAYTYIDERGAE